MAPKKIRVGILCGGRSAEHEVSLQSAQNIYNAIDKTRFEPFVIGITKDGRWLLEPISEFVLNTEDSAHISLNPAGAPVAIDPHSGVFIRLDGEHERLPADVVFPVLHGPFGEDGTVQGLLKLAGLPFVGSGVLGSAAGMDKDCMKRLFSQAKLRMGTYMTLRDSDNIPGYRHVIDSLGTPFFVKPANMGSSVGVSKIQDAADYEKALKKAFQYDRKIILEAEIAGREIECAVLESGGQLIVSPPGEIRSTHEFYSYEAKYLDEHGAVIQIPAALPEHTVIEIQRMAREAFIAIGCEGLCRVDFFVRENGDAVINEVNTLPGFTKISMYPKLCLMCGIDYTELISRLIDTALSRFEKERHLKTTAL